MNLKISGCLVKLSVRGSGFFFCAVAIVLNSRIEQFHLQKNRSKDDSRTTASIDSLRMNDLLIVAAVIFVAIVVALYVGRS